MWTVRFAKPVKREIVRAPLIAADSHLFRILYVGECLVFSSECDLELRIQEVVKLYLLRRSVEDKCETSIRTSYSQLASQGVRYLEIMYNYIMLCI